MVKVIDTREYVSELRKLVEEGKEVGMRLEGSSMAPFLVHERDYIFFKKPDRELRKGDMVFYQRTNGQFVMHRICKVNQDSYDMIGDAQTAIEYEVERNQIFAIITQVKRKGKIITEDDNCWKFFQKVWIRIIPIRRILMILYGMIR